MAETHIYDFFISYAEAERGWIEGYLLVALTQSGVRCIQESAFMLGTPRLLEFERAIKQSRYTLLVITPEYLTDESNTFITAMGQTYGSETNTWPVIPLILRSVPLPSRLEMLVKVRATNEEEQESAISKLCDLLKLKAPLHEREIPPDCPYPGMRPYQQANAEQFYGRSDEIGQLLNRLQFESFTFVIGASGSGKSSLILAGLIPALRRRPSNQWFVQVARPGDQPCQTLENQIQQLKQDLEAQPTAEAHALIVIDQFEELFNQVDKLEQTHFIKLLKELPQQICTRLKVQHCNILITLRADFFGDLMNCDLWDIAKDSRFEIVPLKELALQKAIAEPAKAEGVYFDERLLDRLINDAGNEPGVLPLLQETLILLWERMKWRWISLDAYEEIGEGNQSGLSIVLAKKADDTYSRKLLNSEQQTIAQRIFLRLVQFGEGRPDTRRQLPRTSLISQDSNLNEFDKTVDSLTKNRLLTLDDPTQSGDVKVDISHEALLSSWSRLQKWLEAYRSAERSRRRLEDRVERWLQLGKQGGFLDEVELREANNWISSPYAKILGLQQSILDLVQVSKNRVLKAKDEKETLQREKLEQAQRLAESERRRAEEQTRANKKLRQRLVFAILTIVIAICMAITAFVGFQNAEQQRQVALARQLAAQAEVLQTQKINALQRSFLLALESMQRHHSTEAEETIRTGLDLLPTALTRISCLTPLKLVIFSPTAESIAVVDTNNVIHLYQTQTGRKIVSQRFSEDIKAIVFDPTNNSLAVATNKNTYLLARKNLRPLTQFPQNSLKPLLLAFSSDGSLLAINTGIWNIATSQKILDYQNWEKNEEEEKDESAVRSVAFSSNGELIALGFIGSGADMEIRTRKGQKIKESESPFRKDSVSSIAFNPNSNYVAVGLDLEEAVSSDFSPVLLYKIETVGNGSKRIEPILLLKHEKAVSSVAFSLKGRYLATASFDGTSHIIDLSTRREIMYLKHGYTNHVSFSSDEKHLITWDDRSLRVWDVGNWREVMHIADFSGIRPEYTSAKEPEQRVAVDFQGKYIATVSNQKELVIWTLASRDYVARLQSGPETHAIAFSPNGKYLATTSGSFYSYRNIAALWDVKTKRQIVAFNTKNIQTLDNLAFSKNGKYLASQDFDETYIWDINNLKRIFQSSEEFGRVMHNVRLIPDGQYIAFTNRTGDISIQETASRQEVLRTKQEHEVNSLTFSPKGTYLATTNFNYTTKIRMTTVWSMAKGQALSYFQHADEEGNEPDIIFSPDERLILTRNPNYWQLWEAASGREMQQIQVNNQADKLLRQAQSSSSSSEGNPFSLDGRYLVTGSESNFRVWDTASGQVVMQLEPSKARIFAFSSDGALLAVSSPERITRLWNTHSWEEIGLLSHSNPTNAIAFNIDGKYLAVTNNEETQIWNVETLQIEALLAEPAREIAFSTDSQYLAVANQNSVFLWPWRPDKLFLEACSRLARNLTQDEWEQYLGTEPYRKTCPNLP